MIEVGQIAPDFSLPDQNGTLVTLTGLRPMTTVLYFYPRDDTPGCTIQANDFTDLADDFARVGAKVVGVSRDDTESHTKFCKKFNLNVTLVSDVDGELCNTYGVWLEKNLYGKKYMGIERTTVLIGPDGVIQRIWHKVKAPDHATELLSLLSDAPAP